MTQRKTVFGSETRAVDGCIVTFRLSDGSEHTERFVTLLRSAPTVRIGNRGHNWKTTRFGPTYIEQAVEWADVHEARIVCMSTPETILRDLQGTRGELEAQPRHRYVGEQVKYPERSMLGQIGRADLFLAPNERRALERTPRVRIREDVQTSRGTEAS